MSTDYPAGLDSFATPGNNLGSNPHSTLHINAQDAIEALQAKVGIDGSGVTTSHDYKLSAITGSDVAISEDSTSTLTNKTIDADNNTISNIEVDNLKSGVLDTDLSTVAGTDTTLPSALAVKTYVDAQITASNLDFQADTGGALSIDLDSEVLTLTGGTGVDTSGSGNAVTFAIDSTVATLSGTQNLTNKTLTTPTLTLKQGSAPTPTAEGDLQWDTDDNAFKVGDGTGTKTFTDDSNHYIVGGTDVPITDGGTGSSTASGALINLGLTATATELNYTDGVTSAIQTQLDNKQPLDSELSALAGLTSAADKLPYFTGSGTASLADFTAAGRALVDDSDNTAQRTTLGLGSIATQASSNVSITGGSISGITDLAVADGGTGASDASGARTNLGLVIGTNVQAFDADLTTLSTAFTSASASGSASLALHEDIDNGTNKVTLTVASAITSDVTLTLPSATDTLVGKATTDTLTNKTIDANGTGNSISNLEVADLASGVLDTDLTSVSGSDDTIPSAKATKTALDLKAPLASPSFTGTVTLPTGLTGVLRADSGVVSTDSDVTDLVSAASDTAAGKVELATTAETTTGTDTGRAVTPDGLHDMTSLSGAAWFLDEDDMTSDSATKVASQQSIKAYVDAQIIASGSGDVVGPASATDNAIARFNLTTGKLIQDSVVTIADTTGNMAGVGTINTLTLPSSDFSGVSDSETLTNKTIDGDDNTLQDIDESSLKNGGTLRNIYNYTYDGTDIFINGVDQNNAANTINWTKPSGLRYIIVKGQGAGGGGGASTTTANTVGNGGGGGAYFYKKILAASLGATETITIGALGAGGATTSGNGSNGGNTSFGAHATANGGNGGGNGSGSPGAGGTATGGDLNIPGQSGSGGGLVGSTVTRPGEGGDSMFGFGGVRQGTGNETGQNGSGYGSGGAGGHNTSASRAGGNGTAGLITIEEYF